MSTLSQFMHGARAILDERDRNRIAPNPHQPPVFVRTNWLFVEIDEALTKSQELARRIAVARLERNPSEVLRLSEELAKLTAQNLEMIGDVRKHFSQELKP
jgi:hypothetical protein